jgi:hypothetical protein
MCLENKHVHQCGFSVMQVSHNSNITNHLRETRHVQQEPRCRKIAKRLVMSALKPTLCRNEFLAYLSPPLSIYALLWER